MTRRAHRSRARLAVLAIPALAGAMACGWTADEAWDHATGVAKGKGLIPEEVREHAETAKRVTAAARRTAHDFTDAEEHYLGRSVAAEILTRHRPVRDDALNLYVSKVGLAVAYASDRPELYRGYRFQVLDSPEVNAYAAPGGFVFITRGLLELCEDEDALAGVLAHEVAHVALRHGLEAIKQGRLADAFQVLVAEGTEEVQRRYSPAEVTKLAGILDGAVQDIGRTVLDAGYSRTKEEVADRHAATYLARAGYDPTALVRLLEKTERGGQVSRGGVLSTHAQPAERIEVILKTIREGGLLGTTSPARTERFRAATGG